MLPVQKRSTKTKWENHLNWGTVAHTYLSQLGSEEPYATRLWGIVDVRFCFLQRKCSWMLNWKSPNWKKRWLISWLMQKTALSLTQENFLCIKLKWFPKAWVNKNAINIPHDNLCKFTFLWQSACRRRFDRLSQTNANGYKDFQEHWWNSLLRYFQVLFRDSMFN